MMEKAFGVLARALYTNQPESKNELYFRKGDILTVIEIDYEGQPGWWMCALRGERGICPGNYLELVEDKYSLPSQHYKKVQENSSSQSNSTGGDQVDGSLVQLKTYDVPRSQRAFLRRGSSGSQRPSAIYANENQEEIEEEHSPFQRLSPTITKVNPLELYDIPHFNIPIYATFGDSLARKRRQYGQESHAPPRERSPLQFCSRPFSATSITTHSNAPPTSTIVSTSIPKHSSSNCDLKVSLTKAPPLTKTTQQAPPPPRRLPSRKFGSRVIPSALPLPPSEVKVNPIPISLGGKEDLNGSCESYMPPVPPSSSPGKPPPDLDPVSQSQKSHVVSYRSSHTSLYNKNQRSSTLSESADSGIGVAMVSSALSTPMQDLYDVPRSYSTETDATTTSAAAAAVGAAEENNVVISSRPQSSMSISSSGMGLSIANSGSKDSLDMYDVPRSVNSYVNHLETKYDQLAQQQQQRCSRQTISNGSLSSLHNAGSMEGPARDSSHSPFVPPSAESTLRNRGSVASTYSGYGYGGSLSSRCLPPPTSVLSGNSYWGEERGSSLNLEGTPVGEELYDVPRSERTARRAPAHLTRSSQIVGSLPSVSVASLQTNSSGEEDGLATYDVPSPYPRKVLSMSDSTETLSCPENLTMDMVDSGGDLHHLHLGASSASLLSTYGMEGDTKSIVKGKMTKRDPAGWSRGGASSTNQVKVLPLAPKAAVSVVEKLRQEVVKSIVSILEQVKPKWRSKANLAEIMSDIRFSATRLNLAIKDLCDFCSRCLSNAIKLGDKGIQTKLHRLLMPLINASQIIQRDLDELDAYFWSADRLSVPHSSNDKSATPPDALDQLILCARSLKHDVTEMSNFLAINSSALFQESDISSVPTQHKEEETPEDYDYVSLVSMEESAAAIESGKESSRAGMGNSRGRVKTRETLHWRDEQLLEFYSVQIGGTAPLLSESISTFISAIHQNEPPKVFNSHLKYVILLAYKMLFAGDTTHRNLTHPQLKEEIEDKANELNKAIVTLTEASKVATRDFPRIPPMQAIVDRVWSVTAAATQLKKVIFNATCALQ